MELIELIIFIYIKDAVVEKFQLTFDDLQFLKDKLEEIYQDICQITLDHCFGCIQGLPSQRQHSCLMLDWNEQIELYFPMVFAALKLEYNNC